MAHGNIYEGGGLEGFFFSGEEVCVKRWLNSLWISFKLATMSKGRNGGFRFSQNFVCLLLRFCVTNTSSLQLGRFYYNYTRRIQRKCHFLPGETKCQNRKSKVEHPELSFVDFQINTTTTVKIIFKRRLRKFRSWRGYNCTTSWNTKAY